MAPASDLPELDTPVPLVDLDILDANLKRMAAYTAAHSLSLRPHVKTHKSPMIATRQLQLGAKGLTCATLYEVEVMTSVSSDILLAYPPVGAPRLSRLLQLPADVAITVALDSDATLRSLSAAADPIGRTFDVLIEVDVGMRRVGLQSDAEVLALAQLVDRLRGVQFAGIAFYPGHIRRTAAEEGENLRRVADRIEGLVSVLSKSGLAPRVVSGGSTPAAWQMHQIPNLTEVRPGTYVFNDRITAATEACTLDDCALTVLATVVSVAVPGQAVVDAGSKALGREPMPGGPEEGYGVLLGDPTVRVVRMSEEHGILDISRSDWLPAVGDRVRIIPNHVCYVVNLSDEVIGIRSGAVESDWKVAARGR